MLDLCCNEYFTNINYNLNRFDKDEAIEAYLKFFYFYCLCVMRVNYSLHMNSYIKSMHIFYGGRQVLDNGIVANMCLNRFIY